ncbi:MAG: glycosyltransferase family 2 protein [Anaerolineaceae bacterium]|nr:glycosyltransferase family 2 protein [Anaerolineaceae bacterium]
MADLSIIIVSWNVADLLAACLDSVFKDLDQSTLDTEVIVVDSASSDHSVAMLENRFPSVQLLACDENIGFARANNLGLQRSRGGYVLLLNPDTEVLGGALDRMAQELETHPRVGAVGPHTLNSDGTTQSTRRRFPTLLTACFESTWLQPWAPKKLLRDYRVEDRADGDSFDVDWVQGSALMLRREVYEEIGGLDPDYVMYSEELDWCRRAKAAGWRVRYVGDAKIVHHGGRSSEQAQARSQIHFQQSKLRYIRIWHGERSARLLRLFLLLMFLHQLLLEVAKGLLGHKRPLRQQRVRAYWQVLRSGLRVT